MATQAFTYEADVEPLAGLALRDARPFQAGQTSVAHMLPFPPPPAPFWSAARAAVASARTSGAIRHFQSRGVWLVHFTGAATERLFPCPLDLVEQTDDADRAAGWALLSPLADAGPVAISSARAAFQSPRAWESGPVFGWRSPGAHRSLEGTLLNEPQWHTYLGMTGAEPPRALVTGVARPASDLWKSDVRVGTELEGRRARTGRLYSEPLMFLERDTRFQMALEFDADEMVTIPERAHVRLGGEAKLAHLELRRVREWNGGFDEGVRRTAQQAILRASGGAGARVLRVKLCLLTPAIFGANIQMLKKYESTPAWRPTWLRDVWVGDDRLPRPWWARRRAGVAGCRYSVRLVTALTGKPYPLGFWDSNYVDADEQASGDADDAAGPGGTRPLYRCLPPGAVYFLELRVDGNQDAGEVLDDFFARFWLRSILLRQHGVLTFFGKMGFGLVVIGGWTHV